MAMQAVRVPGSMCASLGVQLGSTGGAHTTRVALLGARPALSKTSRVFSVRSETRVVAGGWMEKLGFGVRASAAAAGQANGTSASSGAQGPDDDVPAPGREFATFGAGCFWGVELAFQRVQGVAATEVGYTQGHLDNPDYYAVCSGATGHSEVVRVQYDPKECSYKTLLDVFWKRHDPTTLNRQGNDMGTQYRSGVYFYTPEQEQAAQESKEEVQKTLSSSPIVTEILPAKKFYRAEEYHQQYLAKGGRGGNPQSPAKGCSDPIRCYG